ncbi:MAG: hypothetical protein J7M01_02800 [Candidatus Marinimicrobia bacterium]|nr:hypothetical protein [Candidatus Neomarinimicrobiota bacterium]
MPKAIVLSGDWHPGVIGIVSSKVKDNIHRPVFLIALKDGYGKGSGRSIRAFDLYDALSNSSEHLSGYGGHQMAAGLTIKEENIPAFEKQFIAYANEHVSDEMLESAIYIDANIEIQDINDNLMKFLHDMEPFGPENMRPKFSIKNVSVFNTILLKDKHLKFAIKGENGSINCIGWNMLEQYELVMDPVQRVDMVFVPTINEWNGVKRIQLVIKDIRQHIS